ncbi:hypothetical protein NDU88_001336, partial [Pleurodeles waltl]
ASHMYMYVLVMLQYLHSSSGEHCLLTNCSLEIYPNAHPKSLQDLCLLHISLVDSLEKLCLLPWTIYPTMHCPVF